MLERHVRLFSDATHILITAMEPEGVKRLICVASFNAGDSREHMTAHSASLAVTTTILVLNRFGQTGTYL